MSTLCGIEIDSCLFGEDTEVETGSATNVNVAHNKNIDINLSVGEVSIPVRKRNRVFTLDSVAGTIKDNLSLILDLQFNVLECYTPKSLYSLSVAEDSTWVDSAVYIADTEHSNAFWQEVVYTCKFSGSSTDTTTFHHPTWVASKLRIDNVNYHITRTWKLMVNGKVEILHTESEVKSLYSPGSPLFFVYPMPMSGETADPDFLDISQGGKGYSFLDYRTGGDGPSEAEIKSGGQDYYYPEYLWYMGDHREEDQADAVERFNDTYGSITNVKGQEVRNLQLPHIWGPEDPRGSIVVDYAGNVFASVLVTKSNGTKLWFNRLNGVDPNLKIIDETITVNGEPLTSGGSGVEFSEVIRSYFPIGLMVDTNG